MKIGTHGENNEESYDLPAQKKSNDTKTTEEGELSLDVQHTVTETRVKKHSACGIGP